MANQQRGWALLLRCLRPVIYFKTFARVIPFLGVAQDYRISRDRILQVNIQVDIMKTASQETVCSRSIFLRDR